MIQSSKQAGASDIHVQPEESGVKIRFRVNGVMREWERLSLDHKSGFLLEAKRLSGCSIAVSGKAQDARLTVASLKLDLRVNLIPTLFGEKLVLRLLKQDRIFSLESLGLSDAIIRKIKRALSLDSGVMILTGPTGAGKTTTLYSSLTHLDAEALNIMTVEDPVEYRFPDISQISVTPKLPFSETLKNILRQDPDVILFGEIRDRESAKLCFQAAETGHLVLTTLHANGASEVTTRLRSLDVEDQHIKSCLRFCSAQRLLPKLCSHCRLPDPESSLFTKNPSGCSHCQQGISGMVLLMECLEFFEGSETSPNPNLKTISNQLAKEGVIDASEINSFN
ncbi:unnamed protein product [Sphagnum tenellum]